MTQDQVEKFISQYLNQATRHSFENLMIKDFKSFDCEIEVEVAHTIIIKAMEDTSREPKGELLTKGDYQNAITTITRDEQQNPAIIDKLKVGGQAVLGRQSTAPTPWLTERHGYDPTSQRVIIKTQSLQSLEMSNKILLS
ncbi:hypothetical protein [Helicobacter sp.]|uniref:hypothetical protein n=1 Tax=Helicobacter sp. TaxID=218 RepID=UPI00388DE6A2